MNKYLLVLLVLCACEDSTCPNDATIMSPLVQKDLEVHWVDIGLPMLPGCSELIWEVTVGTKRLNTDCDLSNQGLTACPIDSKPTGCIFGCSDSCGNGEYVSYYLEGSKSAQLVAHEAAHVLAECNLGNNDYYHENPMIWGPDGFVRTYTGRWRNDEDL